jgi:protein-L-isoaspartate(D-aspartate) O-methyltransferase
VAARKRPLLILTILLLLSGSGYLLLRRLAAPAPTPASLTSPAASPLASASPADEYHSQRESMVRDQIEARRVTNPAVLEALRRVPRHSFVPEEFVEQAYADHPLPIGHGQTISQPYIVALMTEALQLTPGDRVLEIGTGSGYQAAILAEMGLEVFSVEIIPELSATAAEHLALLGYDQVSLLVADGYFGWPDHAPYQAIIVTCAPDHLPQPLADQLAEGGRLVIPIGPVGAVQTLWLFTKTGGQLSATNLGDVRFVPLVTH